MMQLWVVLASLLSFAHDVSDRTEGVDLAKRLKGQELWGQTLSV